MSRKNTQRRNNRLNARLRLEPLEARDVPASFTVTTGADAGVGSLRDAVAQANAAAGADTIQFAAGVKTVTLTTASLSLTDTVGLTTVDGGKTGVVITRDATAPSFGLFDLAADAGGKFLNLELLNGKSAGKGGAINTAGGLLTVSGCTFANNSAALGGGAIFYTRPQIADILNSTFYQNSTGASGGAIEMTGGTMKLVNDTFLGNTCGPLLDAGQSGGAISVDNTKGIPTAVDCIFVGNFGGLAPNEINGSLEGTSSNNIVDDFITTGALQNAFEGNQVGVDISKVLPDLAALADNGGPTRTIAILPTGLAVDTGDSTKAVDSDLVAPTTDQRGLKRVAGKNIDVGAIEVQPTGPVKVIADIIAFGPGAGTVDSVVKIQDLKTNTVRFSITPYAGYKGIVRVAVGDVTGDGKADLVTAVGSVGAPAHVKVFDGVTGQEVKSFIAFANFMGGLNVAVGDVDADSKGDIIVGAGVGGNTVSVFSGANYSLMTNIPTVYTNYSGGVTVAAGDLNGDGKADIVTGTATGAAHVKAFDGTNVKNSLASFIAYKGFAGGINVAFGLPNANNNATIVTSTASATTHVKEFQNGIEVPGYGFIAYKGFAGGANVTVGDLNNDGVPDIVTGSGAGVASDVRGFDGTTGNLFGTPLSPLDPKFLGGVFVG